MLDQHYENRWKNDINQLNTIDVIISIIALLYIMV
jgi:hypothetical protein